MNRVWPVLQLLHKKNDVSNTAQEPSRYYGQTEQTEIRTMYQSLRERDTLAWDLILQKMFFVSTVNLDLLQNALMRAKFFLQQQGTLPERAQCTGKQIGSQINLSML